MVDEINESSADRLARYMRAGTLAFSSLPPLSLYVHLPWCLKKCPYCDFNSHEMMLAPRPTSTPVDPPRGRGPAWERPGARPVGDAIPEARYLDALCADLEATLPLVWGRRVRSVFIGGGTPSLFSPDGIARLIADVRSRLQLEPGCEITLEANPGTFERERFRAYRAAGVTRLSVGVQSFDDAKLQALGRVHSSAQARLALDEARAVFDTFNIDLMYALPGQTLAELESDLRTALSYAPPHLSVYHLTIEPNTLFAKHPPEVPDDDAASDMLDTIVEMTSTQGLERYEVSAFARPDHKSVHNTNYWQFGDYLGIGAGAHGKLTFAHRIVRHIRYRDPARYMDAALAGQAIAQDSEVTRAQLPFEFMLNQLRLFEGFALERFVERTGLPLSAIEAGLAKAESQGLLERTLHHAKPTPRGFDFLSDLQALFLP